VSALSLRRAVRAVVLDEDDRVLLCRLAIPEPAGTVVWVTPGGGVERGETPFAALRRELLELIADGVPATPVALGL
jgi:8-oxo-dGTP diphosphatase